jgi:hypothetical protein
MKIIFEHKVYITFKSLKKNKQEDLSWHKEITLDWHERIFPPKKNGIELFKVAAVKMEEEYLNIDFSSVNTKIEFIKDVEVSMSESNEYIEKMKKYCGQIYGRFQSE